jgi:TPR repeat protein
MMYFNGDGVEQNTARAVRLFEKGCDGGNALGCANLGFMYSKGNGVEQNKSRAVQLYGKACDGGDAGSCFKLGVMYFKGDGVMKSAARAADYLRWARFLDPNIVPAR